MTNYTFSGSGDGLKKLLILGGRNILITSALPYVNNFPHLGNIIGCNLYHVIHREVYDWFDISLAHFGLTSTPHQTEFDKQFLESYWITIGCLRTQCNKYLYCDVCHKFLADRLVDGTCPYPDCSYNSARGDQCEKCSKRLNPTELVDPKSKVCRNIPHIRDTNHFFLELPLLKDSWRSTKA
ncbi:methionine--tRNA ligase [Artemisia annua]|uniref:methionine--tRNA ligase n=1 Tax=Artemisia annua TaxID=35608 RepID=A0A2U1P6M6_ARTAN|nr:methionine--tRNA ligase [Artemisia annua]